MICLFNKNKIKKTSYEKNLIPKTTSNHETLDKIWYFAKQNFSEHLFRSSHDGNYFNNTARTKMQ